MVPVQQIDNNEWSKNTSHEHEENGNNEFSACFNRDDDDKDNHYAHSLSTKKSDSIKTSHGTGSSGSSAKVAQQIQEFRNKTNAIAVEGANANHVHVHDAAEEVSLDSPIFSSLPTSYQETTDLEIGPGAFFIRGPGRPRSSNSSSDDISSSEEVGSSTRISAAPNAASQEDPPFIPNAMLVDDSEESEMPKAKFENVTLLYFLEGDSRFCTLL